MGPVPRIRTAIAMTMRSPGQIRQSLRAMGAAARAHLAGRHNLHDHMLQIVRMIEEGAPPRPRARTSARIDPTQSIEPLVSATAHSRRSANTR